MLLDVNDLTPDEKKGSSDIIRGRANQALTLLDRKWKEYPLLHVVGF